MSIEIAVGDVLMARLEYSDNIGGRAYNVLHYRVATVTDAVSGLPAPVALPAEDVLPDIADDVFVGMAAQWQKAASDQVAITGCTVQSVWPSPRSVPYTHTPGAPVPGLQETESLPLQDAPTLLKRTRFGMRWGIGRLFYVGLAEALQDIGVVNGIGAPLINDLGNAVKTAIVVSTGGYNITIRPVLADIRYEDGAAVLERINDIVSCNLSNNIIKTQRRRRPGNGI